MGRRLKHVKLSPNIESAAWLQQLMLRLKEGVLIALGVVCIYLWMILLTFDAKDSGFSFVTSEAEPVQNAGGQLGAWLADVLLSSLGYFAWLLPLVVMLKIVLLYKQRYHKLVLRGTVLAVRTLGLILLVTGGTALSYLHFAKPDNRPQNFNIFGTQVADYLTLWLNVQGATLVLLACFLVGVTLFTNLSWFRLMDLLGQWTLAGLNAVLHWLKGHQNVAPLPQAVVPQEPSIGEQAQPAAAPAYAYRAPVLPDVPVITTQAAAPPVPPPAVAPPPPQEQPQQPVVEVQRTPASAPLAPRAPERLEPVVPKHTPIIEPVAPSRLPPLNEPEPVFAEDALISALPPLEILDQPEAKQQSYSEESLESLSRLLETKLKEFGVKVEVESVHPGPVVTRFEIQLAPGVKVSRISNLAKDLARSMAMISVRVVEVIPGKTTVGIEVPNEDRQIVRLTEVLESPDYEAAKSAVTLGLGHDIGGRPVLADLAKMPHLLVAGTTGSGKSVGVNAMILSILLKSGPEDARLIMIDPKMLELSIYEGIPHLLCPVVTDMKEAANALRWCVAEMERRYKLMAAMGVRNLAGYNRKVKEARAAGTPLTDPGFKREHMDDVPPELDKLPIIVVVVDEFADMMMIVGKKVEELIARIAQKARAAGIHLILATQRPSVDVITGLIKANIPTRMAFQVSSKIDSRTILDQGGAEQLLGHGDMLYLPPGTSLPERVHGAFVSDDEVHRVVDAWKARGAPNYVEEILAGVEEAGSGFGGNESDGNEDDPLYDEAVYFVTEARRVSISSVQRKFKVGYNRAARMVDAMEAAGVVSPAAHNGSREVLAPPPPVHD